MTELDAIDTEAILERLDQLEHLILMKLEDRVEKYREAASLWQKLAAEFAARLDKKEWDKEKKP